MHVFGGLHNEDSQGPLQDRVRDWKSSEILKASAYFNKQVISIPVSLLRPVE